MIVGALLGFLVPAPASAAETTGLAPSLATRTSGEFPEKGGWFPSRELGQWPGYDWVPTRMKMSEPYYNGGAWYIDVDWTTFGVVESVPPSMRAFPYIHGNVVDGAGAYCGATATAPVAATPTANATGSAFGPWGEHGGGIISLRVGSGCNAKFLQFVQVTVGVAPPGGSGTPVPGDAYIAWDYGRSIKYRDYDICDLLPALDQCRYRDGEDFDEVCKDAPAAEFGTWGWLPPWIGHYAVCLFKPINGWQSEKASTALAESSMGAVHRAVTGVSGHFSTAETCGSIGSGDLFGTPLSFDTCTWSSSGWAGAKGLIGTAALVFAVIAGLFSLARAVFGAGSAPSGGDDE